MSRKKRVLQVVGPSAGGIRRHVAYLADELERRGWDVVVAGPRGVMDGLRALDLEARISVGPSAWRVAGQLADAAASSDVVHAHGLSAGWTAALIHPRPPLVVTGHNVVIAEAAGWRTPLLRVLERRLATRVNAVIAVSSEVAQRLAACPIVETIPAAGPRPVPARSAAEVRAAYGISVAAPLCVTVARLHPQKGLDVWLRALPLVLASVPDVRALIVGDGPDGNALRSQAEAAGLRDAVVWAGSRPGAADELGAADVVVIPSRWEGSQIVLAEAMALGRPIVTTTVGRAPEWLDATTAWLVPADDPTKLAGATIKALTDPTEAGRRGAASAARLQALNIDVASFDAIEAVYDAVMR